MSTIAPPSKPINPALVDSEHYIEDKIRRTRRALKLVDLAAGVITLAIGLLTFVLLAAVLDHWVVPGGLNEMGRAVVFGIMLAAVAWYGWRQFVPLLRSINPVYAAHTIERGTPSLKNSLLNLLVFRTHRQQLSPRVYHALEQQAAQRLSTAPLDTAIDRSALLRLGYALLLIIAVAAAYGVLSPKNMAVSAARVLAPWSDLQAPSRVQIINIRPGDTSLAVGERLEVEATIDGLRADDAVRVRYSTMDEQLVDESVSMKSPDAGVGRFVAQLPRGGEAATGPGVQQSFVYWIEAGDASSKKYKVTVFSRPTLIVQKVRYEYPAYTGFPSNEVEHNGDIRGIEGTRVTISAVANQPIKNAYVDFDADGRNDLRMTVEGKQATASFPLALREDRRTPEHVSYLLRFTSAEGRVNTDPPKYQIDVTPDYAPEVRITSPEEPERTVRVDETVPIEIEARDPDFALAGVRLVGKVGDREATLAELLTKKHEGRFGAIKPFTPGEVRLKAGDVLEYWAEARDNRRPDANVALSEHRRLKIAGAAQQPPPNGQQPPPKQQPNGGEQQRDGQQPQNGENSQGGEQGEGGPQQQGEQAGGESEGAEGEGQQGAGGVGAEGQQNAKAESQDGAGREGQAGESQANDAEQQPGEGAPGGANANGGEQPQDGQGAQQPSQGAQAGDGNSGDQSPAGGANQQGQPPGAQGQAASSQDGQQGGEPGAAEEKVSSDGSDDASAFQKLAEKLNPQASGEPAGAKTQAEGSGEQASAGEEGSAGEPNAQQEGADAAGAKATPSDQAKQEGQGQAAKSPPDSSSNAASGSKNESNQKPQAEGAQSVAPPREKGGDAEQQAQGAGQSPDQPQGADIPRESKTGDGNPGENKDAPKPSAEGATNENQGNAGAGHNSEKQEGSPTSSAKRATDKEDAGDRNKKLMDDEEPPSGSESKRESDSDGGQGGDQAGGGQEGAGQHADAPGKGESGQNEAADTGGGRADERGMGETGTEAGGDQLAEGKTGESSGDQRGEGSQQGDAGESGESAAAKGPDGKQPGASAKPQAGKQGAQPDAQAPKSANAPTDGSAPGEQGESGGEAGSEAPQGESPQPSQGQPGEKNASTQPAGAGSSGASQPQGGGQGGVMTGDAQQQTEEAKADEANLEFARKQTDLVLERLDDQLAKKQVDAELLKSLGWSEAELSQFVSRWKNLKTRAESEGNEGEEAQQELDDALRSLGLRPRGPSRVRATTKADELRVNDSYRSRAPIEYADRVRMYSKNVAAGDDANNE